jgi:pimeloyl-ACP methyl ester carboxylesterase
MASLRDANYALLSRDWAGLVIAVVPAAAGAAVLAGPAWAAPIGVGLLVLAGLMVVGALVHISHMARLRRAHPAPGTCVDIGGYRLHLLAEGEARDRATVVWLTGGHGPGYLLHHLHVALSREARSILIDRPGTGWSDPGPFPRTTAREADEVVLALERAGEAGPFLWTGHSFGGLLAANIARRRPDITAGVMLLDPTPPDVLIYGPPNPGLAQMSAGVLSRVLKRLFGFHSGGPDDVARKNPAYRALFDIIDQRNAAAAPALKAFESGTKDDCASASIFRELQAKGFCDVAWDTVVYDGDLGDTPVWLVAPGDLKEFAAVADLVGAASGEARMRNFYARTRERYLATSTRSERVYAPAGTGHNFPHEAPEFTVQTILKAITR